ncbi:MAG: thioredoxin-disulfide reductase [Rhodobacteraceae bacterium]|nr:thioredoxin-disulfide reductase [Paracoccaceae bacterium]
MTEIRHTRLLIVGSGPTGYTAAIYAARAMLNPLLIQGIQPGGQLTITTDVENWPGDINVQGPDLMQRMEAHAVSTGAEILNDHVQSIHLAEKPFRITLDSDALLTCDALILATGAQARWLGLDSEDKFKGHGVSACATCDGFFYRDQDVAVIGGGNTAVEEALFLTNFARKVTLIHRRDSLRAEKTLQKRLFNHEKIHVLWDHVVDDVLGSDNPRIVSGLRLRHARNGAESKLDCKGVFVAIGHTPASELVASQLQTRAGGYVITKPESTETSIDGVFAAGDLVDSVYRQAVTSAGMGCMAALDAERYLSHRHG